MSTFKLSKIGQLLQKSLKNCTCQEYYFLKLLNTVTLTSKCGTYTANTTRRQTHWPMRPSTTRTETDHPSIGRQKQEKERKTEKRKDDKAEKEGRRKRIQVREEQQAAEREGKKGSTDWEGIDRKYSRISSNARRQGNIRQTSTRSRQKRDSQKRTSTAKAQKTHVKIDADT